MAKRHPSALKRNRQSEKKRVRNRVIRARFRGEVRDIREAIDRGDAPASEEQLRVVMKSLDKAVTKGVLHRNAASRRIGRLSKQVAALKKAG